VTTDIEAEAQAIIRDAMRYRFLRTSNVRLNQWASYTTERLDAEIDKFMEKWPGETLMAVPVK
jgi:hypothetical protein